MKTPEMKVRLSTLWIVVLFNMLFADIFSIMVQFVDGGMLDIPGDVKMVMAIAAVITNIPILMIYFSRVLPYRSNRIANVSAGIVTIVYVIGGGSAVPHYIIIATIEVVLLLMIIVYSWKWSEAEMSDYSKN